MLVNVRLPKLQSSVLCSKLSKGMGQINYGEPLWPNDILFIYPVVILGCASIILGVSAVDPIGIGEPGNLCVLPNKFIGVLSMIYLPVVLLVLPFAENLNPSQNPWRRPLSSAMFVFVLGYSLWLSIGSLQPLTEM